MNAQLTTARSAYNYRTDTFLITRYNTIGWVDVIVAVMNHLLLFVVRQSFIRYLVVHLLSLAVDGWTWLK